MKEHAQNVETPVQLISATEAYEKAKVPQQKRVVKEIEEAIRMGRTETHVCFLEKLFKETIDFIISNGYDLIVEISPTENGRGISIYNRVFWGENASGKYEEYDWREKI